jgi:hypothetical protein
MTEPKKKAPASGAPKTSSVPDEMHEAIKILASFVRTVHLKRVLHDVAPEPRLNFWRVIYGNFTDMAVIEWSKLFGYDRKQPTQWRSAVPEAEHAAFQRDLVRTLGLSRQEWHDYQDEIKTYRDKRAAHHASSLDTNLPSNFPRFDLALKAARFYYDWILKRLQDRGKAHHYPLDLDEYCQRFSEQAREVAQRAIAATATMDEKVR